MVSREIVVRIVTLNGLFVLMLVSAIVFDCLHGPSKIILMAEHRSVLDTRLQNQRNSSATTAAVAAVAPDQVLAAIAHQATAATTTQACKPPIPGCPMGRVDCQGWTCEKDGFTKVSTDVGPWSAGAKAPGEFCIGHKPLDVKTKMNVSGCYELAKKDPRCKGAFFDFKAVQNLDCYCQMDTNLDCMKRANSSGYQIFGCCDSACYQADRLQNNFEDMFARVSGDRAPFFFPKASLDRVPESTDVAMKSGQQVNRTGLAAVAYLVKNSKKDLRNLYNSLSHLSTNFCKQNDMGLYYPVFLFSDGCIDGIARGFLKNVASGCQLRFEIILDDFIQMPDFIPFKVTDSFDKHGPGGRGLGYGQMIRWNLRTVFEHPNVQSLQFILRLDTDSFILTPMTFDPFQVMVKQQPRQRYAYFCNSFENAEFSIGIHSFVADYMWHNNITSPWDDFRPVEGEPVVMPYNNIEIVDVEWWRSEPVQHFVDAVDRSLGIWHHRWGDAPLRGMAISLFLHESELLHLQSFQYAHPWQRELEPLRFVHVNASVKNDLMAKRSESDVFGGICKAKTTNRTPQIYQQVTLPVAHDCRSQLFQNLDFP